MFERQLLTVGEIVDEWKSLLLSLWEQNPELKLLFTVSPIRHWKDGAHGNQLSKATLLLAIDALQKEFPEHTAYFPAYEIMMDELRSIVLCRRHVAPLSRSGRIHLGTVYGKHAFA